MMVGTISANIAHFNSSCTAASLLRGGLIVIHIRVALCSKSKQHVLLMLCLP